MSTDEMSNSFDTLLNSYFTKDLFGEQSSYAEINLDEYEKSVFLTKAQEEIVINLYNGKNPYGEGFEFTEELRRYLDSLIKTKVYLNSDKLNDITLGVYNNSIFFKLPDDIAFITLELATFEDSSLGCYNGATVRVMPITHDEYGIIEHNPFRGATKYKILRMDYGDSTVEIISKYKISKYLIKYLSKPSPIVLVDLKNDNLSILGVNEITECKLNSILHNVILERAVQLAYASKSIAAQKTKTT